MTVFGRHPVRELLSSDAVRPRELLLRSDAGDARLAEFAALAAARHLPVRRVSREQLDLQAEGGNHQGVAVMLDAWPYRDESDLDDLLAAGTASFLAILDHLQDVGNLGSVLRSAHLCGVDGVIIPRDRAAQVTSAVVRISAGAAVFIPVYRVGNLTAAMEKIKAGGFWIHGLDAGGTSITRADLGGKVALVLGGEGAGLSRLVRERCDALVGLPMTGRIDSHNAAVAMGIALFEVLRRRLGPREGSAAKGR